LYGKSHTNFFSVSDKQNEVVRTLKTNSLFAVIPMIQKEIVKTKNGKSIQMNQFSVRVTAKGLFHDPLKLRFENSSNKKTLKQAWRFFV
jgi:hypothetical protein